MSAMASRMPAASSGLAVRRIAIDGPDAVVAQPVHRFEVQLDDGRLDVVLLQHANQRAAHRAIAHDDGVAMRGVPRQLLHWKAATTG